LTGSFWSWNTLWRRFYIKGNRRNFERAHSHNYALAAQNARANAFSGACVRRVEITIWS
jgi:hypothetical protein